MASARASYTHTTNAGTIQMVDMAVAGLTKLWDFTARVEYMTISIPAALLWSIAVAVVAAALWIGQITGEISQRIAALEQVAVQIEGRRDNLTRLTADVEYIKQQLDRLAREGQWKPSSNDGKHQ